MLVRRLAIALVLAAGLVAPATGVQSAPSWNFDGGLQGWTVTGLWAADGTPTAGVNVAPVPLPPGGSPIGPAPGIEGQSNHSPPNSLNYNDGTDYDTGVTNAGTASSPLITITATENIGWWCAYETENTTDTADIAVGVTADTMSNDDRRLVRVRNSAGTVVFEQQFIPVSGTNPPTWLPGPLNGVQTCQQMGEWHTHYLQLDPAWSPCRIEFFFSSDDALANQHTGWFIDDVAVGSSSGGGGPGGSGPGGGSRENSNGDDSGNDLFGESWCGGGSAIARSGLGLLAAVVVVLGALMVRRDSL